MDALSDRLTPSCRGFAARTEAGATDLTDSAPRGGGGNACLFFIQQKRETGRAHDGRHLLLIARGDGEAADLEFVVASDETNLEDQMALLSERAADACRSRKNSPCGCCGITPHPCAISNFTIPTWSRSVWGQPPLDEWARSTQGSFLHVFLTLRQVPAIVMGCPQLTRL